MGLLGSRLCNGYTDTVKVAALMRRMSLLGDTKNQATPRTQTIPPDTKMLLA